MSGNQEALQMADDLDRLCDPYDSAIATELRRLVAELERKSDVIQKLWKERDEVLSENQRWIALADKWAQETRNIHRVSFATDTAQLQEINTELASALNAMLTHMGMDEDEYNKGTFNQARAVLAKVTTQGENK